MSRELVHKLDKIIELLELLIAEQRATKGPAPHADPVIPRLPPLPRDEPVPDYGLSCSKCGIDLSHTMGYVCNVIDCPTGMGPTIC